MVNNKKKKGGKKPTNSSNKENTNRGGGGPLSHAHPPRSVDARGRMPERHGRQFYQLLTLLAALAVPKLNRERAQSKMDTLVWYDRDMAANTMEAREIVMSYILHEIDWLAHEVEQTRAEPLVRQILGRRLSQDDRANIRSWRVHVKDDFFVVSHSHAQQQGGTVMVQVGRLQHRDFKKKTSPDMVPAGEFHAPRVFVVQGLADPLSQLTARPRETFLQKYPSIAEKHAEFKDALCLVRTALLPYNSGITYMTTLMPITLAQTEHYATPQDLAAAVDVAVKAYRDAFPAAASTASGDSSRSSNSEPVALYRSLDPERDAAICRLVKSVANQELPAVYRSLHDKGKEEKQRNDVTRIVINQIMWQPLQDRNDPQFAMLLERATNTGRFSELNERQPFCLEGCKNSMGQEIVVQDDDPCPFHKRYGEANPTFAKCCKTSYLKRMQKAQQKGNAYAQHLMYEPVERVEVDKIEASHNPTTPFNIMPHIRIGYQDIGTVRLRVDPRITSIIKQRIDSCDLFHAVLPHKWLFWGYCPCKLGGMGIMSFGDVTLDPETGWLEANAMTSGRLGALIKELKHFCTDFAILEASLEMEPSYKTRVDPVAFEKNKALLQQGLAIEIRASINKEGNSGMGVYCRFCGVGEEETASRLLVCACKSAFYCCKEHQRQHWRDHKEQCQSKRSSGGA